METFDLLTKLSPFCETEKLNVGKFRTLIGIVNHLGTSQGSEEREVGVADAVERYLRNKREVTRRVSYPIK